MGKPSKVTNDPRELVHNAVSAASTGDVDKAIALFGECMQEYTRKQHHFKALAVSKKARSVLGQIPKVSSLIIRAYLSAGLIGDAQQEYESASLLLKKSSLDFFKALNREAFLDLLGIMDIREYPKDRIVVRRGEAGTDVFVVITGSCEVYRDRKKLGVMLAGDVFGEIGFFARTSRSATVKTLEKSTLVKMPSEPLNVLKDRHISLRQMLESIYSERIMKKVIEDLQGEGAIQPPSVIIAMLKYEKGQDIPRNPEDSLAILKHGIVEIDYDARPLKKKQYLKPGAVISNSRSRARASTDVVIVLTKSPDM